MYAILSFAVLSCCCASSVLPQTEEIHTFVKNTSKLRSSESSAVADREINQAILVNISNSHVTKGLRLRIA